MTCDILTPGHIMVLEEAVKKYKHPILVIGLLTAEALKGYKKCTMSFEDRKYILEHLDICGIKPEVVSQLSLDPYKNLIKYNCMAIVSGDGWEESELKALDKWIEYHNKHKEKIEEEVGCKYMDYEDGIWKPQILDIQLPGERKGQKLYASSRIKNKIKRI